jgi:hypothetical protein
VHDLGVGDVAVSEHDVVDALAAADGLQLALRQNRYAFGIALAGECRRVAPALDARNLCSGEGDDAGPAIAAEDDVEVVEVATRRRR